MTIEGLGKKFQEARVARKLTLDEAARMTKIRRSGWQKLRRTIFRNSQPRVREGFPAYLREILDVDVTPYLDAFEDSESVTWTATRTCRRTSARNRSPRRWFGAVRLQAVVLAAAIAFRQCRSLWG
jgi:hypothetical protein